MLKNITINLKFKKIQDCIDLLDMLLLYSEVNVMLDPISTKNILDKLGISLLIALVESGRIKIYFKENVYGPAVVESNEIFLGTYTSKSNTLEVILYQYHRQFNNNSINNWNFVKQHLSHFHPYRYPIDFRDLIYRDLLQLNKLNKYFSLYTNTNIPGLLNDTPLEIEIVSSGGIFMENELYKVNYHGDVSEFQKQYNYAMGYEFSITDFLLHYGESKGDFLMASAFDSEVSNPINIPLFKEMSVDVLDRNLLSKYQLNSFNEYVLKDLNSVGEAYLNKTIGMETLLEIYKSTEQFRSYLRTLPDSKNIVGEYNKMLKSDYDVKNKSNKHYRFLGSKVVAKVAEYAIKAVTPPIAVDLVKDLYSYGHDAFDTFVYDKIVRGWRPNGMLIDFEEKVKPKLKS